MAAVAVGLAACGDDGGEDASAATTSTTEPAAETTTSTTLSPEAQAEAEVRAAYDAYWAMSERLAAAPDPADPEIVELTTGGAQEAITTLLTQLVTSGDKVVFLEDSAHDVLTIDVAGDTATLTDCHVEHAARIDIAATDTAGAEALNTLHSQVRLNNESGAWRIAQVSVLDQWSGAAPCV